MSKMLTAAVLVALLFVMAGCGKNEAAAELKDDQMNVVTSFYPVYFLAKSIGGEAVNVVNLIPAGVEPHDWTPKSQDLNTASKAQLLLYNGAGLETWVEDFLQGLPKDSALKTKAVSDGIALIEATEEEHAEHEGEAHGEEEHAADEHAEEDHAAEEKAAHEEEEHAHEHAGEHDPHTWVSPRSMLVMADNVLKALSEADAANQADFETNYKALKERLTKLDADFSAKLGAAKKKDIVTTHQAFGYLARDYGLNQVAIMGLSPDAEPKAQDLLVIAKFVKEKGITHIFFEELVSAELAQTLARETGAETLVLNPAEGLTKEQESAGDDYVTLMERNLENLVKALQ
ncbi:metal ABC transporter solute-binding protein, Zn/Mn family [Paenibacillus xanthanilyticus]|uniref:Metal ABC transporter solute-binding protein, Zn/Mn family n=1 Tax=Paenibacillus xanthanilyticus TaxID=1783531 RepID=A0ABV8KCR8_9BACL